MLDKKISNTHDSIEPVGDDLEQKRLQAIERLKAISQNSRLGLYNPIINREDAHDRFLPE